MTSRNVYFQNILLLALNSEKALKMATSGKFQLDLKNDQDIGNLMLT